MVLMLAGAPAAFAQVTNGSGGQTTVTGSNTRTDNVTNGAAGVIGTTGAGSIVNTGAGANIGAGAGGTFTNHQTNTNTFSPVNVNAQDQSQKQKQQQQQGQIQGQAQNNHQTIAPSQDVTFKDVVQDRIPAMVVAPGLTAAGTGVCLGSVSIGLSGPMAGLSFGITKVDQGCEQRSAAALLYQMGYRDAAVRLLMKNADVSEALGADAPRAAVKVSAVYGGTEIKGVSQQVLSPAAVASVDPGECQGNDLKVTAANGQSFCRAR
jgi:hypothetical protein